jgi:hypothetical protein
MDRKSEITRIPLDNIKPDPVRVMKGLEVLRNMVAPGGRIIADRAMASYAQEHDIPYERVTEDPPTLRERVNNTLKRVFRCKQT